MAAFFIGVLSILILLLFIKVAECGRRIKDLEKRIRNLSAVNTVVKESSTRMAAPDRRSDMDDPSGIAAAADSVEETPPVPVMPLKNDTAFRKTEAVEHPKPAKVAPPPAVMKKPAAKAVHKEKPEFIVKLEKQMIENWTGILGAAILVMGVGFLAIYAALSFAPVFRTGMVFLVSMILFSVWIALHRRKKWVKFSRWMRSASGAVFVFASIGAGGIPGLQCIHSALAAFILLLAGIVINLAFGYLGGTQYFASLHSLISLAGLAAAPQSEITFAVAGIIVTVSVLLSFRDKWDYHLLICILSFFGYHIYWYSGIAHAGTGMPLPLRMTGIATTLTVGIAAIFSHYRHIYKSAAFSALPFIVHLLNWLFLGIGLMFYSTGSKWVCVIVALSAIIVFVLARHARKIGIRWLYVTDILISQLLSLMSIVLLARWGVDSPLIAALVCVEAMIFLAITIREGDWITQKAGIVFCHTSLFLFGLFILKHVSTYPLTTTSSVKISVITGAVFLLGFIFHLWLRNIKGERFDSFFAYMNKNTTEGVSILGFFVPVLLYVFHYVSAGYPAEVWITCSAMLLILFVRQRMQGQGLICGLCVVIPILFTASWYHVAHNAHGTMSVISQSIPFAVLAAAVAVWSKVGESGKWYRMPGIYIFTINLVITGFYATAAMTPAVRSVLLLIAGIVYFESARVMRTLKRDKLTETGNADRFILHGVYVFIALFLMHHLSVDLQYEASFSSVGFSGLVNIRSATEILALAVFLHMACAKRHDQSPFFNSWRLLHPLMWELVVAFSAVPVLMESPSLALPAIWAVYSHALLFAGRYISRMRLYAILFFWISLFDAAFVLSVNSVPSEGLPVAVMISAAISVLSAVVFSVRWYSEARLDSIDVPPSIGFMKRVALGVVSGRNIVVYYLSAAAIMFVVYRFTEPVSPFIPGCLWLVISMIYLGIAGYLGKRLGKRSVSEGFIDNCMLYCGIAFVIAFVIRHISVHLQSGMYIGPVTLRLCAGIFGLAVIMYWATAKPLKESAERAVWRYVMPLMTELFVAFFMLVALVEVPREYHSYCWVAAALALLFAGSIFPKISRLRLYSLSAHWIAIFIVSFLLVSDAVPGVRWYSSPAFIGAVTIAFQILFAVMFYQRGELEKTEYPASLFFLPRIAGIMKRKRNLAVFYPLFAGIAIFIYTGFSPSFHTLLWVAESFVIFVVSVILRENHFRFLSMGTLGICLVRLVAHDLSTSGTIVKGVVFVGVGLIMVAMNVIYNKYRSRF